VEEDMKTLTTLLFGLSLAAFAQPRHERVMLGEAHVDGAVDHDRIVVTAARGEYRAIQFRVENSAIDFDRVVVHFGNGTTERIALRHKIRAGEETRVVDLPGDRRVIESIEFWYGRGNWRNPERPKVVAFGFR
jgi:hypothetical protein